MHGDTSLVIDAMKTDAHELLSFDRAYGHAADFWFVDFENASVVGINNH